MPTPLPSAASALAGVIAWTFLEYWAHRRKHARRATVPPRGHHRHHAEPSYFLPALTKVLTALVVAVPISAVGVAIAGEWAGGGFAAGMAIGYLAYERIHWTAHYRAPRTPYGRGIRRNHFAHHFMHPRHNYGFTTSWWDRLFGTYVKPDLVKVPRRHALPWLLDGDKLRPEFARDYVLVGRSREPSGGPSQSAAEPS
jgi:sterol desaturase/sphingolipid hydroxylase (fatty acid hydroxylase superfamily)